jgi:hypothetical protein
LNKARVKRLILPLLLLASGTYLLVGCIPLPGNYKTSDDSARPESKIGKPGSAKPVRLGETEWNDVIAALGEPDHADQSVMVYQYDVHTFTWFFAPCFFLGDYALDKTYADRFLLLRFDEQKKLKSYRVFKDENDLRKAVPTFTSQEDPIERRMRTTNRTGRTVP